jgi:tRNA-dihydrouridine synthase 1
MVGASELAFRLLCRRYGADVCYTPMMSARAFAQDESYRAAEFQTCPWDRPLVCHFSANCPEDFAAAARAAVPYCDAIDLNLGCPQRTAYVGHFGSYLLDPKDRELVCDMIRAAVAATNNELPVCCKIRLLDTVEESTELCRQLERAGVSWIAVHARYRASWERHGPGARDGPALLDQVAVIKKKVGIPIIANGNVVSFRDVEANLTLTGADAIMSAEGILDNPALFLPRWGSRHEAERKMIMVPGVRDRTPSESGSAEPRAKVKRKIEKRLREIKRLEDKNENLTKEENEKVAKKDSLLSMIRDIERSDDGATSQTPMSSEEVTLESLYHAADSKVAVATEYVSLVTRYPVKIRSVVFHVRRMLKEDLMRYQLMEDLLRCELLNQVEEILLKIDSYKKNPKSFVYDQAKATEHREALERKRREEGKRKDYESRMMRKAKREGKDLNFYLNVGAAVPSTETVKRLRAMGRDEAMEAWKKEHSQHCLSYHLDPDGCNRGRACAFLHVESNSFVEVDEVAG